MKAVKAASSDANAFAGYRKPPTATELNSALGTAKPLWDQLLAGLATELHLTTFEWNTSSPKRGWSLRVKRGERIIAYLVPMQGSFHACFVLGERARQSALNSGLSHSAVQLIRSASKCAAGTGVRLPIQGAEDISDAVQLAAVKLKA